MKLKEWRIAQQLTRERLAGDLNVHIITVLRWEHGVRVPDDAAKKRIFLRTMGAVTPNDFYDLPTWRRLLSAMVDRLTGTAA